MFRADTPAKSIHDLDDPLIGMSLQRFQKMRRRSKIRKLLTWPIIVLRMGMLKLALATCSLDGLTIEAIPAFWLGDPVPSQYHTCIRTRNDLARLVAEVTVTADDQVSAARIISIRKIRLPYYSMKMRWLATDKQQEEARP